MVFSREIVTLLFLRGAFTEQDVEATAQVLFFYSLGLLAFSIKDVMLNVFYALQDTKTPTVNSVLALVINTVLNILLLKPLGVKGLALATTLSGTITLLLLAWEPAAEDRQAGASAADHQPGENDCGYSADGGGGTSGL